MERRADTDSDMEDVPVDAFLQSARDDDRECLEQSPGMRGFVRLDDVLADCPARHETQDFTETIGFGSPSLIYGLNSNFVADSFSVRQPDFSELDASRCSAEAEPIPVEELEADDAELAEPAGSDSPAVPQEAAVGGGQDGDEADDVPVLESLGAGAAFSFSVFGRDCLPVTELLPVDAEDAVGAGGIVPTAFDSEPAEAIVANADGTFCIADRLPCVPDGAAALDTQLKALIDSVL